MGRMKEKCNWREIGTLMVITVCLVSVMCPAMTQSSFSLFNNASNAADRETGGMPEPTPSSTPIPTPTLTPTPSPIPTPSPATPPTIVSFAPVSHVYDVEGAARSFNVTIDQAVNVSWLINNSVVQMNTNVRNASYTNASAEPGKRNVSAIVSNENGTDMRTWIWNVNVSPQVTPTPDPTPTPTPTPAPTITITTPSPNESTKPLFIRGYVSYTDGTACDAPFVVVTNLNTTEELIAENHSEVCYYRVITSLAFVNTSNVLQINASKNGTLIGNTTHRVNQTEIERGRIAVNINEEWALPDLTGKISTPSQILEDMENIINVSLWNDGAAESGEFNVSFSVIKCEDKKRNETYTDETQIFGLAHGTYESINFSWKPTSEGCYNITVIIDSRYKVNESDETNNILSKQVFVGLLPDFTVTNITLNPPDPDFGDHVEINATIENFGNSSGSATVSFYVNDSSKIAKKINVTTVSVDVVGVKSYVVVDWNTSLTNFAGDCTINVTIDPDDKIIELNESNNSRSKLVYVDAPDLTVVNLNVIGHEFFLNITHPVCDYPNNVTAAIMNKGNVSANTSVEFYAEKDIFVYRMFGGYNVSKTDVITQPEANKIKAHFSSISIPSPSYIRIYDKYDNPVDTINSSIYQGYWSTWIDGDSIRICSHSETLGNISFYIDKYEYAFANTTISVSGNETKNVSEIWSAAPATITKKPEDSKEIIMVGDYTITVIVDPDNRVIELNEENNKNSSVEDVWSSFDFAVTDITFTPESPREGEVVTINASIDNFGLRSINTTTAFFVDGNFLATKDVCAEVNETKHVTAVWDALPDINHPTEGHDITVIVNPDRTVEEQGYLNNVNHTLINITLANLTITNIILDPPQPVAGESVNVIATIRNNENETANSTAWFFEEDNSINIHQKSYGEGKTSRDTISHPDALMMRVHFSEMYIMEDTEGFINVSINGQLLKSYTSEGYSAGWTEWGLGNTTLIQSCSAGVAMHRTLEFTVDKYQAVFGNTSITLPASESKNFSMVLNATQGNHTLWVQVNKDSISRDVFVSETGLAVMNVSVVKNHSVVSEVWDGDRVTITANITNKGRKKVDNFTVVFMDNGIVFNVTNVSGLDAGNSTVLPPVLHHINIKRGTEVAYNHSIRVEIDPYTRNATMVHVKHSRDFEVTNLSFTGDGTYVNTSELMLGELVTVNATVNITNLANSEGNVSVGFYIDDKEGKNHLINDTFINRTFHRGNGTVYASFDWRIENLDGNVSVFGNHNLTVIADPGNETIEHNETNNASCHPIYVKAPDLVVTNIIFVPASPEEEEPVNITATVVNNGDWNESNATVKFVDEWKGIESPINNITIPLNISERKNISVNWTASPAGLHNISVSIEAEKVPEHKLTNVTVVRGADLTVSNLSLTVNGTVTETIKHGDVVNITANITNIGIRPANGFNVSFFVDDVLLNITFNTSSINLTANESINNVSAIWSAAVGSNTLKVAADPEDRINETDETNNTMLKSVCVQGADLSVADITFTVIPPENATNVSITNASNAIFDTDTVMINATIANQGILPANNFTVEVFCSERRLADFIGPSESFGWINIVREWEGTNCIYVDIEEHTWGDLEIYNKKDEMLYKVLQKETGWYLVKGDKVKVFHEKGGEGVKIRFYAGNITITRDISLDVGGWTNVSLIQSVNTGDHPVRVFVDLENNVTEHDEGNNIVLKMMEVLPSRDFTADLRLFRANGTEIGANDTVWDGDTVMINTTIGMGINESDPYNETRKGTAEVEIINEHEWVDVSPRYELTPYGYCNNITYPGADALRVHFKELNLPVNGFVVIKDKKGQECWSKHNFNGSNISSDWIPGDTVYVCKVGRPTYYDDVGGRITFVIDKYQYRKLNSYEVPLNASETENITAEWNASAWNHTMRVIADPGDKIVEINESNNRVNKTIEVKANKDPAVINITFQPEEPAMGSDVAINALVANKGNKTATFSVDLWAVKTEYHPFESPHGDDFPCYTAAEGWTSSPEWEINTTYPEADWMGVHFTRISTREEADVQRSLYVDDENDNRIEYFTDFTDADIWLWAKGNSVKLKTAKNYDYESPVWGFSIDKHGYKLILNRTTLTLAPNETVPVTGILRHVRAGNESVSYTIHATVDMDNVVYETNESNNEWNKTLTIPLPDLAVSEIEYNKGKLTATIENKGLSWANNVTVRFQRDVKYPREEWGSDCGGISQEGANVMQVHVECLSVEDGGYLKIGNGTFWKQYDENKKEFWSPWIGGGSIILEWSGAHFKIDRYGYGIDENIGDFEPSSDKKKDVQIPAGWSEYEGPYNLTVWVDPLNEIFEGCKQNNKKSVLVYVDLVPESIDFIVPPESMLSIDAETFVIEATIKNDDARRDAIAFPAGDFNVTLEVKRQNDTVPLFPPQTQHVKGLLPAGKEVTVRFEDKKIFPGAGNYTVTVIADSTDVIAELDENNNIAEPKNVTVDSYSRYRGGPLAVDNPRTVSPGGKVVYRVHSTPQDFKIFWKGHPGDSYTVHFDIDSVVPDSVDVKNDIELARLYLTWWLWKPQVAALAGVEMEFNGNLLDTKVGNYSEPPKGSVNYPVGLYSYDVKNYLEKGDNEATVRNNLDVDEVGIGDLFLLIIYRDDNETFTKYWIAEGCDLIQAKNNGTRDDYHSTNTSLPFSDCIVTATFSGVEQEDVEKGNATLLAVLASLQAHDEDELFSGDGKGDELRFKGDSIGTLIGSSTSHWSPSVSGTAFTENEWEDVTDYLQVGENRVEFQSKGNYLSPEIAILKIAYPPDLVPSLEEAPSKVVIGNSYEIPVVIRNEGMSRAKFNVSFYATGGAPREKKEQDVEVDLGDSSTTVYFSWTAPPTVGTVEFKVVVDPDNDVEELINKHVNGETNNNDTKTVPVGLGEITLYPSGGGDREELESSRADAVREGAGGETAGGGEAAAGEKGGQAITGYLMKGSAVPGEEGGGRKEEFSMLALLLQLGMLAAAVSLVCAGYWLERRRQRHKQ